MKTVFIICYVNVEDDSPMLAAGFWSTKEAAEEMLRAIIVPGVRYYIEEHPVFDSLEHRVEFCRNWQLQAN